MKMNSKIDMEKITFRNETPADYKAVENLTREAFWNVYKPGCDEHFVLHNFRTRSDFVPELDILYGRKQRSYRTRDVCKVRNQTEQRRNSSDNDIRTNQHCAGLQA